MMVAIAQCDVVVVTSNDVRKNPQRLFVFNGTTKSDALARNIKAHNLFGGDEHNITKKENRTSATHHNNTRRACCENKRIFYSPTSSFSTYHHCIIIPQQNNNSSSIIPPLPSSHKTVSNSHTYPLRPAIWILFSKTTGRCSF